MLPNTHLLPLEHLAALFNNTSASYKIYWFWAILEIIKKQESRNHYATNEVVVKMISLSWQTITSYKLSLGPNDIIAQTINNIIADKTIPLKETSTEEEVEKGLIHYFSRGKVGKVLKDITLYVPVRFLVPFLEQELRRRSIGENFKNKEIPIIANELFNTPNKATIYKFQRNNKQIVFHPLWRPYLLKNYTVLKDFCHWNLMLFLQDKNPNVPNIGKKLQPIEEERDMANGKKLWKLYLSQSGNSMTCIYSGQSITQENISIDHFIPWSFVSHDSVWNLIPTTKSVNSSKSNCLPSWDEYGDAFTQLQYDAYKVARTAKETSLLDDYVIALRAELKTIDKYSYEEFKEKLERLVVPSMQIAQNIGFSANWRYQPQDSLHPRETPPMRNENLLF